MGDEFCCTGQPARGQGGPAERATPAKIAAMTSGSGRTKRRGLGKRINTGSLIKTVDRGIMKKKREIRKLKCGCFL
jgi:hypothetical protein